MSYSRCITPPPFNFSTGMFEPSNPYRATTPPKIRYNVKAVTPPRQHINYNVKAVSPSHNRNQAVTPPPYTPPATTDTGASTGIVSIGEMRPRNNVQKSQPEQQEQSPEITTEILSKMETGELKNEADKVLTHVGSLPTGSLFAGVNETVYGFLFRNMPWLFSK